MRRSRGLCDAHCIDGRGRFETCPYILSLPGSASNNRGISAYSQAEPGRHTGCPGGNLGTRDYKL